MTAEDKLKLDKYERKYSHILENKPLIKLASDRNSNNEKVLIEKEYRENALRIIQPLYKAIKAIFD